MLVGDDEGEMMRFVEIKISSQQKILQREIQIIVYFSY